MIALLKKAIPRAAGARKKANALKALRRLGCRSRRPIEGRGDSWDERFAAKTQIEPGDRPAPFVQDEGGSRALGIRGIPRTWPAASWYGGSMKINQEKITALRKEMERVPELGRFRPRQLAHLRGKGLDIRLYRATLKSVAKLPADCHFAARGRERRGSFRRDRCVRRGVPRRRGIRAASIVVVRD